LALSGHGVDYVGLQCLPPQLLAPVSIETVIPGAGEAPGIIAVAQLK
jgi:hypothetical protein